MATTALPDASTDNKMRNDFDFDNLNLSFNGCGFLGIYHVGVAAAIKHYLPNMKLKNICGASAGAMAAVCLLGGVPFDRMTSDLLRTGVEVRELSFGPLNPKFKVCERLSESLMALLPEDIHITARGRLHISVTGVYCGENKLINNFASKEELVMAVVASTFIPVFSGYLPAKWRGMKVIDGGFSVNQVILDDDSATLTVSPFSGDAHICPQENRKHLGGYTRVHIAQAGTNITMDNLKRFMQVLYPPKAEDMAELLLQGYHDATSFFMRNGVIGNDCPTCLTVKSKYIPSEVIQDEEDDKSVFSSALKESIKLLLENPYMQDAEHRGIKSVGFLMRMLRQLIRWSPPYIMASCSYELTVTTGKFLIGFLMKLTPQLSNHKELGAVLEKFLGFLIGLFGPIIGYKYETVRPSNVGAESEEKHEVEGKAKFSCGFHITQTNEDVYEDVYSNDGDRVDGVDNHEDSDFINTIMSLQLDAFMDGRTNLPATHTDAMKMQAENLDNAAQSRVASRVNSIAPSLISSAIHSRRMSAVASRRGSIAVGPGFINSGPASEGNPETLDNLINVTRTTDSVLQAYYTDNKGEVVTVSLYDISSTDPADIIGNDVLGQHGGNEDDFEEENSEDFDEAVKRKLERLRRRYSIRSGGSATSEPGEDEGR